MQITGLFGEGTKFIAIKRKIRLPANCHYFDLGISTDFEQTIKLALHKHLPSDVPDEYKNPQFDPRIQTKEGYCHLIVYLYKQNGKEFTERYAFPVCRPNTPTKLWFTRGHEEGHALLFFGLEDEIEKINGSKVKSENKECIANLCGLHAVEVRNLQDGLSQRARTYYALAR